MYNFKQSLYDFNPLFQYKKTWPKAKIVVGPRGLILHLPYFAILFGDMGALLI